MLEPHPPHHTPNTWRDFFIHIATIVVGLLIAVGLEQTVEAIHRHRERAELRESLQHEAEQILRDTTRVEAGLSAEVAWQRQVDRRLAEAFQAKRAIGAIPAAQDFEDWDIPDNPIYKSARASNKLGLISQQEAEAFGEMNALLDHVALAYSQRASAMRALLASQRALRLTQPIPADAPEGSFLVSTHGFAALTGLSLSPEEMTRIYKDSVQLEINSEEFLYWCRQGRGAANALEHGERNLHAIEDTERQFANAPGGSHPESHHD